MLRTLRTRTLPFALCASTLLTLALWATPAAADAGERRGGFELFYALPEDPFTRNAEDAVGLRFRIPFGENWSVEASWSHKDGESDFFFGEDLYGGDFVDLSLRYDLINAERLTFFVFGGPGWYSLKVPDYGYVFPFDLSLPSVRDEEGGSIHAGVGLEVRLNERFYVRPDIRHRTLEGFDFEETSTESSFAVGWRF